MVGKAQIKASMFSFLQFQVIFHVGIMVIGGENDNSLYFFSEGLEGI